MDSVFRVQQFACLLCVGADPPRPDVGSDGHRGDSPPVRQGQGSHDLPPPGLVSTCTHVKVTSRWAGKIGCIHWTGVSILCYFLSHFKALYLKFLLSTVICCDAACFVWHWEKEVRKLWNDIWDIYMFAYHLWLKSGTESSNYEYHIYLIN